MGNIHDLHPASAQTRMVSNISSFGLALQVFDQMYE
jgi:hypothetical protein